MIQRCTLNSLTIKRVFINCCLVTLFTIMKLQAERVWSETTALGFHDDIEFRNLVWPRFKTVTTTTTLSHLHINQPHIGYDKWFMGEGRETREIWAKNKFLLSSGISRNIDVVLTGPTVL